MARIKAVLLENIRKLGTVGSVVDVALGHFRYLLLQGRARYATPQALAEVEEKKSLLRQKDEERKGDAQKQLAILEKHKLSMAVEASEKGVLYGTVSARVIAKALSADTKIKIDSHQIIMSAPIKEIGAYEVAVDLYPGIIARVKLEIASAHSAR